MEYWKEASQLFNPRIKKSQFVKEIRERYSTLYAVDHQLPYVKDRLKCEDRGFVELGIELVVSDPGRSDREIRRKLRSYHDVINQNDWDNTKMRIIQGKQGYGKTTLSLQYIHDWCKSEPDSPLQNVELLIFLKLKQLTGITSFCQAIRTSILSKDTRFSEDDILKCVKGCSSVIAIFDGYDEWVDSGRPGSEMSQVISNAMYLNVNVILTTNLEHIPKDIDPKAEHIYLTGLGEEAQFEYIRKAVVGNNMHIVQKVYNYLKANPIFDELVHVPSFFVVFAHMTNEKEEFSFVRSFTRLFKNIVSNLHSHTRGKGANVDYDMETVEREHSELDTIAFEGLTSQRFTWDRESLIKKLGKDFLDHYKETGILKHEVTVDSADSSAGSAEVWFCHKLFCEWFAAHHVSDNIDKDPSRANEILHDLNPQELQYLFRFVCGVSKNATASVTDYLRKKRGCYNYAMICSLENDGSDDSLVKLINDFVCLKVVIARKDNRLFQTSTIQLLEIASKKEILIPQLGLEGCFSRVSAENRLRLTSGLYLPPLSSLGQLEVREHGREMTEEEIIGLINYVGCSSQISRLWLTHCIVPFAISTEPLSERLRNIEVIWWPQDDYYLLDFDTGGWKDELGNKLTTDMREEEIEDIRRDGITRQYNI